MRVLLLVALAFSMQTGNHANAQWTQSSSPSTPNAVNQIYGDGNGRSGAVAPSIGRPIGTMTSETPRYYGTPGLSPAPGVRSGTGVGLSPAQFNYYNNAGFGYYRPGSFSSQFPSYVSPVPLGGGYFQFGGIGARAGYWRSPAGYYYPWCPGVYSVGMSMPQTQTIYMINDGALSPAQPSVSAVIGDMKNFVEDARSKNQIDESNYDALTQRISAITSNVSMLSDKNGGRLNSQDEMSVRRELDLAITEIMRSVNP